MPDVGALYDALDLGALTLFTGGRARAIVEVGQAWGGVVSVRDASDLAPDGWLLVRPDGYLAAAGGPGDAAMLDGWLERWFVRP